MNAKTSELTGPALDWAVAMAEGDRVFRPRIGRPDDWDKEAWEQDGSDDRYVVRVQNPRLAYFVDWEYRPSTSWWEGGPIIERENIALYPYGDSEWNAHEGGYKSVGPTPLIAAMRCFVVSRLGAEVDVPEELTAAIAKATGEQK